MIVDEEHDSENLEEISDSLNKYDEFRPSQVQSTIWSKKYVFLSKISQFHLMVSKQSIFQSMGLSMVN